MTTHQAGAVLMAPQDYDDPAVVKAAAAELGRLGGLARAKRLTAEERAVSARHAARMRWGRAVSETSGRLVAPQSRSS